MSPLCSRNARPEKTLVERAQWGTHPGILGNVHEQDWKELRWSLTAALPAEWRFLARGAEKSPAFLSILRLR